MNHHQTRETASVAYVAPGMPELDTSGKQTSFYEFWPSWLIYLPVVLQSLILAVRHRSLTLPLIANPNLPLSGMVGIGKSELLAQAKGECERSILDWFVVSRSGDDLASQGKAIEAQMRERNFTYPLVAKPDIGCRGSGVKLVHDTDALLQTLEHYPVGAKMLVQKLASWEPEAGIFYVREPEQAQGKIISMALKYTPYVVGDGVRSLQQLIEDDARAGELSHLYLERHKDRLRDVIPAGESYRLVFSASHCRGAIFRDASVYISRELETQIDGIMKGLPEFYYGRMDVKFKDIDSLMKGECIEIIEINSASSESLHIWDRNTTLRTALGALSYQYRTLFKLGAQNRKRGFKPPKFSELLRAWRREMALTQSHPETD